MRPPVCDHCGQALESVHDSVVVVRLDERDVVLALAVVHRVHAPAGAEQIPPREFVDANGPTVVRLRRQARHWESASVSRVLRAVRRLASLSERPPGSATPPTGRSTP